MVGLKILGSKFVWSYGWLRPEDGEPFWSRIVMLMNQVQSGSVAQGAIGCWFLAAALGVLVPCAGRGVKGRVLALCLLLCTCVRRGVRQ